MRRKNSFISTLALLTLSLVTLGAGVIPAHAEATVKGVAPAASLTARINWHSSMTVAAREHERTGKPILLYLYADWCPYSRQMDRQTWSDPDVAQRAQEFVCVRIDVESEEGKAIVQRLNIQAFPTTIVYDPDDDNLRVLTGFQCSRAVTTALNAVLDGEIDNTRR